MTCHFSRGVWGRRHRDGDVWVRTEGGEGASRPESQLGEERPRQGELPEAGTPAACRRTARMGEERAEERPPEVRGPGRQAPQILQALWPLLKPRLSP